MVPELCGGMEEFRCRKDQVPTLSTDAVPSIGEPETVGPTYIVIALPGPGIELVPAILHSSLPERNSNRVIVRDSVDVGGAGLTVTDTLALAVPPAPVAVSI